MPARSRRAHRIRCPVFEVAHEVTRIRLATMVAAVTVALESVNEIGALTPRKRRAPCRNGLASPLHQRVRARIRRSVVRTCPPPPCRAPRDRRSRQQGAPPRDGAWLVGLSVSWGRGARRGIRGREVQWALPARSSSGSSAPSASIEPHAQGVCGSSTNLIVLVSLVVTGRPAMKTPLQRERCETRAPLPFLMTFPVSFERLGKSASLRAASIVSSPPLSDMPVRGGLFGPK